MTRLRRQISLFGGTALAVTMVVGSGIFGLPGLALQVSTPQIAALGWLACALACLPLLAIFAVLGGRYASAAGISRYAEAALGRKAEYAVMALLCGTFPLANSIQAMIASSYALVAFGLDNDAIFPVAIAFTLTAMLFNLSGVRTTTCVNTLSIALVVVTIIALAALRPGDLLVGARLWIKPDFSSVTFAPLWEVTTLVFWAFLGWENVSFGLEEFKNPQRTIKRVYFFSFVVVVVLYFLLAATMNGASAADPRVSVTEGMAILVPARWRMLFSLVTLLIILATANAWMFSATRLFYAAGRNGLLPETFARLDRHGNPRHALLLLTACSVSVLLIMKFCHLRIADLVLLTNQNFVVLYLVCILCFWKIARGMQRWMLTPIALVSCSLLLAGFSYEIFYPLALMALGVACQRMRDKRPAADIVVSDAEAGA